MADRLQLIVDIQNQQSGLDQEIAGVQQLNAEAEKSLANSAARLDLDKQFSAEEANRTAALIQQAAIESQLQVIAQTKFDLAAAAVGGDAARAEALRAELGVRGATLGVMRSEVLTQAELNALTETEAALLGTVAKSTEATAAGSLLAGANLNKARGEAITLSRELATGSVNARTLGALLGSFGSTITIAALAGYEIYQTIAHAGDESLKLAQDIDHATDELIKHSREWREASESASSFGDVVKLGDRIVPELDKVSQKLREFEQKELGFLATFVDLMASQWSAIPGSGPTPNKTGIEDAIREYENLQRMALQTASANIDAAQKSADAWQQVRLGPFQQGIDEYTLKLKALQAAQSKIDPKRSVGDFQEWQFYQRRIEETNKRLNELTKTQENFEADTKKTNEIIDKADFEKLAPTEKLSAAADKINDIKDRLYNLLHVESDAPRDAEKSLEQQVDLAKDQEDEVTKLIRLWQVLLGTISQINQEQEHNSERDRHQEITGLLLREKTLIESIHQQQQLIDANPFLGADDKNEQLHTQSLREQELVLEEIAKIRAKIIEIQNAGASGDKGELERLNKELNDLVFTYQKLNVQIRATTFGGSLQASLVQWVNQFGDAGKQAANVLTGTLNTAIGSTSQALTGLIFQTGNWKQTFASAAQSIVQNIIQIALQYVISKLVMAAIDKVTGKTTGQAATAAATQAAAAWAPAAVSASIASYGSAAYKGTAAYLLGLVVGEAAAIGLSGVGGAAHEGAIIGDDDHRLRLTGPLSPGERLTRTLIGEGVFTEEQMAHLVPVRTDVFSSDQLAALGTAASLPSRPGPGEGPGLFPGGGGGLPPPDFPGAPVDYGPGGEPIGGPYQPPPDPGPIVVINPPDLTPIGPDTTPVAPPGFGDAPGAPSMPDVPGGDGGDAPPAWVGPESHPQAVVGQGGWEGTGASFNFLLRGAKFHGGGSVTGLTASPNGEVPITALLGEYMMRKEAHDYYGTEGMNLINNMVVPIERMKLHDGGSLGGGSYGGPRGGGGTLGGDIHIFSFLDRKEFEKAVANSTANRRIIVDVLKGKAYELGINRL